MQRRVRGSVRGNVRRKLYGMRKHLFGDMRSDVLRDVRNGMRRLYIIVHNIVRRKLFGGVRRKLFGAVLRLFGGLRIGMHRRLLELFRLRRKLFGKLFRKLHRMRRMLRKLRTQLQQRMPGLHGMQRMHRRL